MTYKKVVAYIPDTSVLFELDNGNFALVSCDGDKQITVSKYAESHLKFGGFREGKGIPKETLQTAAKILEDGKNIFLCRDVRVSKKMGKRF